MCLDTHPRSVHVAPPSRLTRFGLVVFGLQFGASVNIVLKGGRRNSLNHTSLSDDPQTPHLGDVSCMKWTGGLCPLGVHCLKARNPVDCVSGRCLCPEGYCGDQNGTCAPYRGERFVGTFAIKFAQTGMYLRPPDPPTRYATVPIINNVPDAAWRIASVVAGLVRFESTLQTNRVLDGYAPRVNWNRWEQFTWGGAWERLLPVVKDYSMATPHDSTFQIRRSDTGAGFEIWDPRKGVAIAVGKKHNPFRAPWDSDAGHGISTCYDAGCDGEEILLFEPPLPEDVVSTEPRLYLPSRADVSFDAPRYVTILYYCLMLFWGVPCAIISFVLSVLMAWLIFYLMRPMRYCILHRDSSFHYLMCEDIEIHQELTCYSRWAHIVVRTVFATAIFMNTSVFSGICTNAFMHFFHLEWKEFEFINFVQITCMLVIVLVAYCGLIVQSVQLYHGLSKYMQELAQFCGISD